MTWVKLDDNFSEHPKVAALPSDAVRWFHVRAMCYAARYKTRGEITPAMFKALGGRPSYATALVEAGLWDTTSRNGWAIHDFERYNPGASERPTKDPDLSEKRRQAANARWHGDAKPDANGDANLHDPDANSHAGAAARAFPSRPDPVPRETTNPTDSSSLSAAEQEILETALSALPTKYQRDGLTIDELTLFARDFAGQHTALATAIAECRRDRELCFAGNLRKHMPGNRPERSHGNGGAHPRRSTVLEHPDDEDPLAKRLRLDAERRERERQLGVS